MSSGAGYVWYVKRGGVLDPSLSKPCGMIRLSSIGGGDSCRCTTSGLLLYC